MSNSVNILHISCFKRC